MRRTTYVLVWMAVTAAAVIIAAAAVGSVRDQVTEAPAAMVPTTSTAVAQNVEPSTPTTASTPSTSLFATQPPTTTTTTALPATTTTTPAESAPSTTTTTVPSTTTTSPPRAEIRSYDLIGGVVTVEIGSSTVTLAGASPKPGFTMEVEDSGPRKVEVEFTSNNHESQFSGEFKDGAFAPEIQEKDRDDEED